MLLSYKTVAKIFLAHLFLVTVTCLWIIYSKFSLPESDESFFIWATFLVIDFPVSIVVMLTSGPNVVSVPQWIRAYFQGWIFVDLIWPAIVFLVIGTMNWVALIYLYKLFSKKKPPV